MRSLLNNLRCSCVCRIIGLLVLATLCAACPPQDANYLVECGCPVSEPLEVHRLELGVATFSHTGIGTREFTASCPQEGSTLISGGCLIDEQFIRQTHHVLSESGPASDSRQEWRCRWDFAEDPDFVEPIKIEVAVACLPPYELQPPPPPPKRGDHCKCKPIEPIRDRFFVNEKQTRILGTESKSLTVSCGDEIPLLAGGCSIVEELSGSSKIRLVSSGLGEDRLELSFNAWTCAWYNPNPGDVVTVSATAFCARPPGPDKAREIQPDSDLTITRSLVQRLFGMTLVEAVEVTGRGKLYSTGCQTGEFLLAGGCSLYDLEATTRHGMYSFRGGRQPGPRGALNKWSCGWINDNPISVDIRSSAVCLRPQPPTM